MGLWTNASGRAATGSKASGLGDKAPWSCRIFIKQIRNSNISKHKCNSLWSFSQTSDLRIISWWHIDRRQVLSTVDRWLSPVDHNWASGFMHSMMMTGCDATRCMVHCCQLKTLHNECLFMGSVMCMMCCSCHMLSVWPNHYPYLSVVMALV